MQRHDGTICETVEEEEFEDDVCCCMEEVRDAIDFALSRYPDEVAAAAKERLFIL